MQIRPIGLEKDGDAGTDPPVERVDGFGPLVARPLFEIDRGTTRFVEHPDGGHYGVDFSSPGWLDDHRVLFWSGRDETAVVFDVRDDSITPVPDLPAAGYGFNAATGTMLLIEWTREADVWLLRFGGG